MRNAEYLEFLFGESDSTQHKTVAAESFYRVDAHAAHKLLDFMLPCVHEIDKPRAADIRIQTLYKLGALGSDAPVALAALAGAAKMTSEREQCGGRDIAGVSAKRDRLDYIRR